MGYFIADHPILLTFLYIDDPTQKITSKNVVARESFCMMNI